ncbi:MAG: LON peptidase substrate-binding domain-containing protein [Terriglobia bacterium]
MGSHLLPLFPLEVVLFPGAALPLHIFEPRYKQMIERCLEEKLAFGVMLARADGLAKVGCTAAILKVVKKYPDGRSDILTIGERRFRLLQVFDDLPYYQGRVEFVPDEDDQDAVDAQSQEQLLELYQGICRRLRGRRRPERLTHQPEKHLSYQLAAGLPLEPELKQRLLETLSEGERQASLLERLEAMATELAQREKARKKASGNGHARPV